MRASGPVVSHTSPVTHSRMPRVEHSLEWSYARLRAGPRQLPQCRGRCRLAQAGTSWHYLGPVLKEHGSYRLLEVQGELTELLGQETEIWKTTGGWEAGSWTPPGSAGLRTPAQGQSASERHPPPKSTEFLALEPVSPLP